MSVKGIHLAWFDQARIKSRIWRTKVLPMESTNREVDFAK